MRARLTHWTEHSTAACAVMLLLLLVGCSETDPHNEGQSGAPENNGQPLPQSEHEWQDLYLEMLSERAAYNRRFGMEHPPDDVEFVRFIRSDEFGRIHSECIRGQGFQAEETFDGGIAFGDVLQDQYVALLEAEYRCLAQYPVHPRYHEPFDEGQIRILYDYDVTVLTPCLEAEGYFPGTPPSWETYLGTFGTGDHWMPYAAVQPDNDAEWQEINQLCPQSPPLVDLYGNRD